MEVEWSTIQSIAETRALEIVMNFPTMALNRTVLPNDPRSLTRARIEKMNRFWGTEDWRADIYEEIPSLFGPVKIKLRKTTAKRLGLLFKARLGEVFPHVTEPLVMKNSSGAPLYCLFLASHKQTGRKIMTDIFRSYERFGS